MVKGSELNNASRVFAVRKTNLSPSAQVWSETRSEESVRCMPTGCGGGGGIQFGEIRWGGKEGGNASPNFFASRQGRYSMARTEEGRKRGIHPLLSPPLVFFYHILFRPYLSKEIPPTSPSQRAGAKKNPFDKFEKTLAPQKKLFEGCGGSGSTGTSAGIL